MGVNKAILLGNVGRDPEIKSLPSGMRLATFSLATTDRRSKDENGNPRTEWHNIVAWDRMVDVVENYVTKGKQLYIEGQIRTRKYEVEGVTKYRSEVHIREMELLGGRSSSGGTSQGTQDHGAVGQNFPDDADDVPF
ncbi:MAG: single-stranded DNA-binding protein [Acidobacteriota bacterium]|nr:single-stranded DNA-binding protein [Acidobacteriota bacterium]